jgi:hypothetical protein
MKRSSYLKYDEVVQLGKRGLTVWGYGKTGKFVCRVEVNGAGIAVFTGAKGKLKLANVSWEKLVERLSG